MSGMVTPLDVIEGRARWCVVHGDALAVMAALPESSIDSVITDPPYSSGGLVSGVASEVRTLPLKLRAGVFLVCGGKAVPTEQRSWGYWVALWGGEALRIVKPQSSFVAFSDWRQLPTLTDAVQAAGWIWRGIVPWNKGEGTRPTPGGFRSQCEYVVWATNGPLPAPEVGVTILPGWFQFTVRAADKHHQTGKPTSLMQELVRVAPQGGVILDPFAGSGTTGVAALLEGRRVILCERTAEYSEIARARCEAAETGADWQNPLQAGLFEASA